MVTRRQLRGAVQLMGLLLGMFAASVATERVLSVAWTAPLALAGFALLALAVDRRARAPRGCRW